MKETLTMLANYIISMAKLLISRAAPVLLGALSGRKFGQLVMRMRTHLEHEDPNLTLQRTLHKPCIFNL